MIYKKLKHMLCTIRNYIQV